MSKEYSQKQITQFFQQFKKLENSFTINKVHQIINDPNATARYKVNHVKPLKLIIMTFLISLSVVLALWFSAPNTSQNSTSENATSFNFNEQKTAKTSVNSSVLGKEAEAEKGKNAEVSQHTESSVTKIQQIVDPNQKELALSDTIIDGSRFILELTNEELEKLGFKINHYTVYYRNSYKNFNVFYLATHKNGRFNVRGEGVFCNMKDYYPLQTDTIPENTSMTYMKMTVTTDFDPNKYIHEDIPYIKSTYSFYPLFNTNQAGEIENISDKFIFNEMADTLLPVVIKCSQLDLEIKRDQFFWFTTNNDFYANLPERYVWIKEEFEKVKTAKKVKVNKLKVDFKIKDWNRDLLIPENIVLNGKDYIVQLTKKELEKLGVFDYDWGIGEYCIRTPYQGGKMRYKWVDGKNIPLNDTVLNKDYYIKYETDCNSDFGNTRMTIKNINEFFNIDDILLPVQAVNKEGTIYWFTLSSEFWKLVPERYAYLRGHYNKMLYNKSIAPNRDFVKYFNDPFKKVGVDVSIIELTKKELENIGFNYVDGGAEINCGFGKNWIQFSFKERIVYELQEKFDPKTAKIRKLPVYEYLFYSSPNKRKILKEWTNKFDSLYAASNQGYQFVYITDSLGRHMHQIDIPHEDIQINGEVFKYLIPIMVRNSKYANPNSEDRVFWFTPTDAFFDRLPNRIKNELKQEFMIVSSEGKSTGLSACTYFESCKSTLKVENMKIYPNPAQQEITIDFQLQKSQVGEVLLANITGQLVKILKPKMKFNEGANSLKCQLEGVKSGIYLVSIVTPLGFKTERIIVKE